MFDLHNRQILITGGTGSFGSKCAEELLQHYSPARLVIFSRDEQKHVRMQRDLFPPARHPNIRYFVGDVRDLPRLKRAMRNIEVVIHAAAMKHVDVAEYNPQECIHTNIGGAENVINASIDCGVQRVIALSTDKAASPINLYGATKLCSDKLFVAANALTGGSCHFSVVRYGNVFGSNGSVVPFFQRERAKGVLPITDASMTRFIITLEQGVQFVLDSLARMSGGEVYIPKIPSTRILDIAKAIAPECATRIVGIRPGEKLHECMVPQDEARQTYEFDDHYLIAPALRFWTEREIGQGGRPCAADFSYTSDNNNWWLSIDELREMVRQCSEEIGHSAAELRRAG
jgi:UDP-N-acetylglucosamine 4,6-dehydratase